jgi:hypothetical protein
MLELLKMSRNFTQFACFYLQAGSILIRPFDTRPAAGVKGPDGLRSQK